jgi:hypothetical protein
MPAGIRANLGSFAADVFLPKCHLERSENLLFLLLI